MAFGLIEPRKSGPLMGGDGFGLDPIDDDLESDLEGFIQLNEGTGTTSMSCS